MLSYHVLPTVNTRATGDEFNRRYPGGSPRGGEQLSAHERDTETFDDNSCCHTLSTAAISNSSWIKWHHTR